MKRIIASLLVALFIGATNANAQKFVQNGNTFVQVSASKENKSAATKTQYVWKIGDKSYPIYISAKGKAYIIKTSKKTGKEYKYYLPDEVAKKIINKK